MLEVALLNYEWHGKILAIQVAMRLLDADTNQVIGRTRRVGQHEVGRAADVLTSDGIRFKTLFTEITRPLVAEDLTVLRFR